MRIALTAMLVVALAAGCGRQKSPMSAEDAWQRSVNVPNEARISSLSQQLKSDQYPRLPLIQELGLAVPRSAAAKETLLTMLFDQPGNTSWAYVDAFAEALSVLGPSEVPKLIDRSGVKSDNEERNLDELVLVLGAMGPKAKSAAPFLRDEMNRHKDNPAFAGGVRAILLRMDVDSAENAAQLRADVAARSPAGRAAVDILGVLRPPPRIDPALVAEVSAWAKLPATPADNAMEDAYQAAKLLRLIGRPAAAALGDLKSDFARFEVKGGQAAVLFALAVWQIDPREDEYLRKALRYIGRGDIGCNVGHCEVDFMLRRMNAREIEAIRGKFADRDVDVSHGAVLAFNSFGLRGHAALPDLLKVVQSDAPEAMRKDAADAMRCAGGDEGTRMLDAAAEKSRNTAERASKLVEAVKAGNVRRLRDALKRDRTLLNAWTEERETPLHAAAAEGPIDMARILLDKGALVNARGPDGERPLHAAASRGRKEIAALLLSKGADLEARDDRGATPLYDAAEAGAVDVAEMLLAKGADVNAPGRNAETPLHQAVKADQKELVLLLLSKGAKVDARDWSGRTPLWPAVGGDDAEMLDLLLSKGANVNERASGEMEDGATLLHFAVERGRREMVGRLLDKGADVNAATKVLKRTPLFVAVDRNDLAVAELLLKRGADPNAKDDRASVLRYAVEKGNRAMADLLVARGARPDAFTVVALGDAEKLKEMLKADPGLANSKDNWTRTPLHWAAAEGRGEAAAALLAAKADPNARDGQGQTPLHLAAEKGHAEVAALLVEGGASVDARDSLGRTPLFAAAGPGGKAEMVRMLLAKGADPKAKDASGETPLHHAATPQTAGALLDGGADVNAQDSAGFTALAHAVNADDDLVLFLLSRKAEPNLGDCEGMTPLHRAVGRKVVQALLDAGADPNARDNAGVTPIFHASEWDSEDVAGLLISKGADVNAKDKLGCTPLDVAGRELREPDRTAAMRKFLRDHGAKP